MAALVHEWRCGRVREREESKMVPGFSCGWKGGDPTGHQTGEEGWRGRGWVEFGDVRGAPRHSGQVIGLAGPCVSFKPRGRGCGCNGKGAEEGQRAGEAKEGPSSGV